MSQSQFVLQKITDTSQQFTIKLAGKVYKINGVVYDKETCKIAGLAYGSEGKSFALSVLDKLEGTQPGDLEPEDIKAIVQNFQKFITKICESKKEKEKEADKPKTGPETKQETKDLCDKDCPDCFAEYRDAYGKIINNITQTLKGYEVGLPICGGGAPKEPGCMNAFYKSETDKKLKDAAAVQPSTIAQQKGLGPSSGKADDLEKEVLQEILEKLGLACPKEIIEGSVECGPKTTNIDLRGVVKDPPSLRGLTETEGLIQYWPPGGKMPLTAKGCKGILGVFNTYKLSASTGVVGDENVWNLPSEPQGAFIINDGLKNAWPRIKQHCCDVTARNIIKSLENVGGDSLFSYVFPETGNWGELTNPCSMGISPGNTIYLPTELTCCLDNQEICPDLKCCSPSDSTCIQANLTALENTISKLKLISDPSESPSCLNLLKASIRNMLYSSDDDIGAQKGLLYKLLRIMLLSNLNNGEKSKIFHGSDQQDASGTSNTPCKARLIEKLGGGPSYGNTPAGWAPPGGEDDESWYPQTMFKDNEIFLNEDSFREAFENSGEGFNICEYPITAFADLKDLKFGGKTIARIYDDLIEDLKIRLRQDIQTIIKNEIGQDIPLSTPEEDKERCSEALKLKQNIEKENKELQQRIQQTETELQNIAEEVDKIKQEAKDAKKSEDRGTRQETTLDSEGNPVTRTVPKDTLPRDSDPSTRCASVRETYTHAQNKYTFSKNSMNRAFEERGATQIQLMTQKTYIELCDRHIDSFAKYPDSHVFNPRLPGLPDIGISGGILGYRTVGDIRPLILQKKQQYTEEVTRLETQIKNLDDRLSVPNGQLYKDALQAKEELAKAGEQVKQECGYTEEQFNPIKPEEAGYVNADDSIWESKQRELEQDIEALKEYINNAQNKIDNNISLLLDLEAIIQKYCSQGTQPPDTIAACFLNCIINKIENVLPQILGVDLLPFIRGIKKESVDLDNNEDMKKEFTCEELELFNPDVVSSSIRDKIKEQIEQCVDNPDEENAGNLKDNCDQFEKQIEAMEITITRLTNEIVPIRLNLINNYTRLADKIPFEKQINDLVGYIDSSSTNENIKLSDVLQLISKTVPVRHNGFMASDLEWNNIRPLIIINLKRDAGTLYSMNLELSNARIRKESLEKAKNNCLKLSKNKSCFEILNTVLEGQTQSVADIVKQAIDQGGAYSNLYNALLDFCRDLLKPAEGGDSANTLADLENLIKEEIRDIVAKACPPLEAPVGQETKPFPTPIPSVPIVDGKPQITSYKLICDQKGLYTKIKYTFNVYRKKMYDKNKGYNGFSEYITNILNRTVLCPDENNKERKSIFHNTLYLLFEGVTPTPLTPQPAPPGLTIPQAPPKEQGPKWLPEFSGGPYWFPPPNAEQVKNNQTENACPKWCGHSVSQMAPKTRFSVLRRLYYEMKAAYEYLSNIEKVVANSISALEALKEGIVHCSKSGNEPFTDSAQGKDSILNPSKHKNPTDPTTAFIKASLSTGVGCSPCEKQPIDPITGKPLVKTGTPETGGDDDGGGPLPLDRFIVLSQSGDEPADVPGQIPERTLDLKRRLEQQLSNLNEDRATLAARTKPPSLTPEIEEEFSILKETMEAIIEAAGNPAVSTEELRNMIELELANILDVGKNKYTEYFKNVIVSITRFWNKRNQRVPSQ